jgi:hypothetical protein
MITAQTEDDGEFDITEWCTSCGALHIIEEADFETEREFKDAEWNLPDKEQIRRYQ